MRKLASEPMTIEPPESWMVVLEPAALEHLDNVRHVLLDFDGTISVLREGWEEVMAPMMVEMICGESFPAPEIVREVYDYVDRSTGILTIDQMAWLEEAVKRYGLASQQQTARQYKALYLERLMVRVRERLGCLERGEILPDDMMIAGSGEFVRQYHDIGVKLYLASGTDHADVVREAEALKIAPLFEGRIYGALDGSRANNKERVIQKIIADRGLGGPELMVVGDGPVEIREAVRHNAIALGVASDEIARRGWKLAKIARLRAAGAQLLIPDFTRRLCS